MYPLRLVYNSILGQSDPVYWVNQKLYTGSIRNVGEQHHQSHTWDIEQDGPYATHKKLLNEKEEAHVTDTLRVRLRRAQR